MAAREVEHLGPGQWLRRTQVRERVLVSLGEAAERVGVSWVTVRNWIEAGHVEAFVVEGQRQRFVEAEQVETWALMR